MKKLNKLVAILVAMAMMLSLAVVSAFAANTAGDHEKAAPAQANLVKYLELAEGVTNPNVGFKFNFEAVENTANVAKADMPAIDSVVIVPTTATNNTQKDGASVYGYKTFETILGTKFANAKAGVYTYKVSETQNAVFNEDGTAKDVPEGYIINKYDNGAYTIRIYVDASGTVTNVTATEEGKDEKEKIDTTDPTSETTDGSVQVSGLTFDNKATKNETGIEDHNNDVYGVLNLKKKVALTSGKTELGEQANDVFKFKVTLTQAYGASDTVPAAKKHTATGEEDFTTSMSYGTPFEVTLKNGEIFYFPTLPAGTTWTVEEDLSASPAKHAQYQAKYDVTSKSLTATASDSKPAGENLKTGSYLLKEGTTGEKAIYTNTYDDKLDTPEGILISNLPYIALALVAIGGLVAYVVVRRKADDEA